MADEPYRSSVRHFLDHPGASVRESWDVEVISQLPDGSEERLSVREFHMIPGTRGRGTLRVFVSPPMCSAPQTT